MTEAALLDSADRDGVRLLTLNRPEKLNALNAPLIGTLIAAVEEADRDDTVGVIVLAGAGRAFSAGADMGEAAEHAGDTHDAARRHAEAVAPVWRLGTLTDKPLLDIVGHPVAVNPDPLLYREAVRRRWPVRFLTPPERETSFP